MAPQPRRRDRRLLHPPGAAQAGGRRPGGDAVVTDRVPRIALAAILTFIGTLGADEGSSPDFNNDVAPILHAHCATCHRPGEAAPFPLISFEDARTRSRQIVEVTADGYMPPWLPTNSSGTFVGERRLSDSQKRTLADWHSAGAPRGEGSAPLPPRFAEGWQLDTPDLELSIPAGFTLPAEGIDVIHNFVIPNTEPEARWIRAVELRPGDKRVVHHAVLKRERTTRAVYLDREHASAPGFPGMEMGGGENPDGHILVWTPGSIPDRGSRETAWKLLPGDTLVLQLHMVPSGQQAPVAAKVGLHFADTAPSRPSFSLMMREAKIDIPPGVDDYEVRDSVTLPVETDVWAIYPHAHYLGKTMQVQVTYPDSREHLLLEIDDWDFNWQGKYRYQEPLRLPAGSRLDMRFTYDNSEANVRNPSYPPRRVVAGNRSEDEMGNTAIQLSPVDPEALPQLREANWRAMLEKDPDDSGALFNLAVEAVRRGDREQALPLYRRAIEIEPRDVGARLALAGTLYKLGRTEQAIEQYEGAAQIDATDARTQLLIGWLSSQLGSPDKAIRHLSRAIELDPRLTAAHHRLGIIHEREGALDAAERHYRDALAADPSHSAAAEGLNRVRAAQQARD